MNNIDIEEIKKITKEKIAISNFQKGANMKDNIKDKFYYFKRICTIASCLILIFGIVFSKPISKCVYNYYVAQKGVTIALNARSAKLNAKTSFSNEEIIDLENNNEGISQDSIKITASDITMDDNNIKLIFDVDLSNKISDKIDYDKGIDIAFSDLLITDENGDILFISNEEKAYKYLNIDYNSGFSQDLKISYDEYKEQLLEQNERYFNGKLNYFVLERTGNNIKLEYDINLVGIEKYFPRCKNINIDIEKITITNGEFSEKELSYNGKWNINLDIPENIYNRKRYEYKEVSNNYNDEYKVLFFNVLDSGTEVKLSLKAFEKSLESPQLKLINAMEVENPTVQIRDWFVDELMASDEYKKYEEELSKLYYIPDTYIEDENGKIYKLGRGNYSNGGGKMTEDNYYEPSLEFNFTPKDMTNSLKLHITYLDTKYVFNLVKEAEV